MENNIAIKDVINIENYVKNIETQINYIIKKSTYSELTKYIKMLPKTYESEDTLFYWGFSYLNEYYKIINKLDKINTPEIEELKYKIYIIYLKENYNKPAFSYNEFTTFSKLLNITFSDYNPNKTRKKDKEPYQSGDKEIDYIVNKVTKNVFHKPHPHAYEITKFKLNILLNILNNKSKTLLEEEFNKINLDDILLTDTLSENRIRELKKKRN